MLVHNVELLSLPWTIGSGDTAVGLTSTHLVKVESGEVQRGVWKATGDCSLPRRTQ
jgi:asparagine synthetase A